eukprot:Nk52_evm10s215 gene=Nk52_evmTU10s215
MANERNCGGVRFFGKGLLKGKEEVPPGSKLDIVCGERLSVVAAGDEHAALVDSQGNIFTCGSNSAKQLGISDDEKGFGEVKGPVSGHVRDVACGRDHTVCCTKEGAVYAWGSGANHQLGLGDSNAHEKPQLVSDLQHVQISKVACGAYFSAALAEDGSVYMWGSGEEGQLGVNKKHVKRPILVDSLPEQAVSLACGYYHTLILGLSGAVYAFGEGEMGKLGLGNERDTSKPTKVNGLGTIRHISCGSRHSACIDEDGYLYAWGCNDHGQLGLGEKVKSCLTPQRVTSNIRNKRFVSVSCGSDHSAAVDDCGILYTFGENRNCKLGLKESLSDVWDPHKVLFTGGVKFHKVECGGIFSLALTESNSKEGELILQDEPSMGIVEVDASFAKKTGDGLSPLDKLPPLKPLAMKSSLPAIEKGHLVSEYEDSSRQKASLNPSALFGEDADENGSDSSDYGAEFVETPKPKLTKAVAAFDRQESKKSETSSSSRSTVSSTVSEPPLPRRVSSLNNSVRNSPCSGSKKKVVNEQDSNAAASDKKSDKNSESSDSSGGDDSPDSESDENEVQNSDVKESPEVAKKSPEPSPEPAKRSSRKETNNAADKRKNATKKNKKSSACLIL